MAIVVRDARPSDVEALYAFGRSNLAFRVSERIPFYERDELAEWIASPRDNLLCVAVADTDIVGFFYCKVMSHHWAMLDNFYAIPGASKDGTGQLMFATLCARLRQRGISYLTVLIETGRDALSRLLVRQGFSCAKTYGWYEYFLAGQR
jgi:GNAT superfamily N-acetyltransferase